MAPAPMPEPAAAAPSPAERARRGAAWAALALVLLVAALTALVAARPPDPPLLGGLDRAWRELALPAPGWAEAAGRALKVLGSSWVMVPLRLLVAAWLLARRRTRALGAWVLAWAVADVATAVLKPAVGRLRPDGSEATAFPSGHAKTAAQVAIGLALLAPRRWRAAAWALALGWVAGMALSRTVLDEHWLSDVVAGSALGAACALGATARAPGTPGGPGGTGGGAPPPEPSPGPGPARGRAP
jgi:undecaprenyl-diphosphatase